MIESFLQNKDFPIRIFLSELNKRELLFFHFLASSNNNELKQIDESVSIDEFYSTIKEMENIDVNLKKIDKERIIDEIAFHYEYSNNIKSIYKYVYNYMLNNFNILNPKIMAIEKFTNIIFFNNINAIICEIFDKNIDIEDMDKKFEEKFYIKNKPVLNSLGLISVITKFDFRMNEVYDEKYKILIPFREEILRMLFDSFYNFTLFENNKINIDNKKLSIDYFKLQEQLTKKDVIINKQKESNKKSNLTIKELRKELKLKTNQSQIDANNQLISKLNAELKEKNEKINTMIAEIKSLKEQNIKKSDKIMVSLSNEISNLVTKNTKKQQEIKDLKIEIETLKNRKLKDIMVEYLKDNSLTEDIYFLMKPYISDYKESLRLKTELDESAKRLVQESLYTYKIGYCKIEEDTHYVVFLNKTKIKILNLPDATYLTEYQFVKVLGTGEFKWAYPCKYEESERDDSIVGFGWITHRNSETFASIPSGQSFKLNMASHFNLKDNQIIAYNNKNELLRFYRNLKHNADEYMPSIKAKGQEIFYVLKFFPNGVFVRNVETGKEEFKIMDIALKDIKEQQTICMKDGEIVNIFYSSKFYTFSSYYINSSIGTAEKKDDKIFIRKLTGEVTIVNDIPLTVDIKNGDVIKVDEFNNFMFIQYDETVSTKIIDEPKRKTSILQKKTLTDKIEVNKNVLIVGNINYENSYKIALLKNGYKTEIIDGYSAWSKIKAYSKDKDYVVIITSFISHDNMWKVKEDILNIPVIYSEFDGANRIVEKLINADNN